MKRLGSVRFDGVLAETARATFERAALSAGATAVSWSVAGERTYGLIAYGDDASLAAVRAVAEAARIDVPPLVVLAIRPRDPVALGALERALGGAGRPGGIVGCERFDAELVVELDVSRTSLALVVDLIDVETGGRGARTIVPKLALSDETLAAFAGALLAEPVLDAERILERHVARAREGACA